MKISSCLSTLKNNYKGKKRFELTFCDRLYKINTASKASNLHVQTATIFEHIHHCIAVVDWIGPGLFYLFLNILFNFNIA